MRDRLQLEASFRTAHEAHHARQRLLQAGCAATESRITTPLEGEASTLTLSVEPSHYDQCRDALVTAGALNVSVGGSADPGWMSHNNGRVTGASVTPGAGDSEAGADDTGPRQI
jgi:hypothetical protein